MHSCHVVRDLASGAGSAVWLAGPLRDPCASVLSAPGQTVSNAIEVLSWPILTAGFSDWIDAIHLVKIDAEGVGVVWATIPPGMRQPPASWRSSKIQSLGPALRSGCNTST